MNVYCLIKNKTAEKYISAFFKEKNINLDAKCPSYRRPDDISDYINGHNVDLLIIQDAYDTFSGVDVISTLRLINNPVKVGYLWFDAPDSEILKLSYLKEERDDLFVIPGNGEEILIFLDDMIEKVKGSG